MKGDSGKWHQLLHLILAPGEFPGLGWGQRVRASGEAMQASGYKGQELRKPVMGTVFWEQKWGPTCRMSKHSS